MSLKEIPEKELSQRQLEIAAKYWKERLRILEWETEILIKYDELTDSKGNDALGRIDVDDFNKFARIRLMVVSDRASADLDRPHNMEVYLIHELLHLKFHTVEELAEKKLKKSDTLMMQHEAAIQSLAEALYRERYGL